MEGLPHKRGRLPAEPYGQWEEGKRAISHT